MNNCNVEWLREQNAATRLCRTGDNTMAFRTMGVRMGKCDLDTYSAACLDLQPIDAPDYVPTGATAANPTDQFMVRPGFEAHPRILEITA